MEPTFTTRWFYQNVEREQVEPGRKTCAVCGLSTLQTAPRKKVLRTTFTDYDVLRVRAGEHVCPACVWYFGRQELRRTGWWLTANEARPVSKAEWLPLLHRHIQDGIPADGYYLIKPSGLTGKHLALLAPLNICGNRALRVQFDTTTLGLDAAWLGLVAAAFRLRECHAWREIRQDDYIAKFLAARWPDFDEFLRLRTTVRPWLRSGQMELAQFVWARKERNE